LIRSHDLSTHDLINAGWVYVFLIGECTTLPLLASKIESAHHLCVSAHQKSQKISRSSRLLRTKRAISRRPLLVGGAALSVLPSRRAFSQGPEPLKVGFLTVNTGPLAAGGKQQVEGAALYLKERGGMIAGRKVELITEDTAGNPALARTKTQELVERYKAPAMIGPLASNEALQIYS